MLVFVLSNYDTLFINLPQKYYLINISSHTLLRLQKQSLLKTFSVISMSQQQLNIKG
ncbi:hypothetical protein NIES4074_52860 [Cylindrospermum sp. NIES-4074]|nr:hypothetical protein NIES4074_52860 [Cylindrospermum sp. NIES-4074]